MPLFTPLSRRFRSWTLALTAAASITALAVGASSYQVKAAGYGLPWYGYGHDSQHTAISETAAQKTVNIHWSTPVDLNPQYSGTTLLVHYGSPLVTALNTVVLPVKTGANDGFKVEARSGVDGTLLYTQNTNYSLPPHSWVPPMNIVLTPRNKLYVPDAGGLVQVRTNADSPSSVVTQQAFYGLANYNAAPSTYDANVKINTPITTDRYGNIFFGYVVLGSTPLNLKSGLARISYNGTGTFVTAQAAANESFSDMQIAPNCGPALSNDHRYLYVAASHGTSGYLLKLDSQTLATVGKVALKDVRTPTNDALIFDQSTASPTVGPDGDVYYGVLENPFLSNNARGWLLHFDANLTQEKTPGAFGWDDTASIVPASMVPSYTGTSSYLVMTKYNNYAGIGTGDGVNKIAILDPNDAQTEPVSGLAVMREVLIKAGPTREDRGANYPDAVREWCINTAAVDPFSKSILVNCEDGKLYRWDLTTNTLEDTVVLTSGIGEAYTPTIIGVDGTVYAINNARLFAVGQ